VSEITGLDGTRLSFNTAPPGIGQADSLFICGGGSVDKTDTAGATTEWGISAPSTNPTIALNATNTRTIEDFAGNNTADWTETVDGSAISNDTTNFVTGSRSMAVAVAMSVTETVTQSQTINLATFATAPTVSPLEDWIRFWFRIDEPESLDYIEVQFSLGNTTYITDFFTKRVSVEGGVTTGPTTAGQRGISDVPGAHQDQEEITAENTFAPSPDERVQTVEQISQNFIPNVRNTWTQIELPKIAFRRSGETTNIDWDDVQAYRFIIKANSNGAVVVNFDNFELAGGTGLQGRYRFHVTFRNSTTGSESNSNANYVEVSGVRRGTLAFTSIPTSPDSQVDQRRIWGTVGGGTLFFLGATISDNATTTLTYSTPDFSGLNSVSGVTVLSSTQLATDNGKFPDTIDDALWDGRAMFAIDSASGARGRIRFSPLGRPESDKGFIDVSSNDEPLQRLFLMNGVRYAQSDSSLYRIDGADPYTSRRVFGISGVEATHRHTGIVTPSGLIWRSSDGVRLFDGIRGSLLSELQVDPIFSGESAENLSAFEGVVGAYGRNEYLISDGSQGLAYHLEKRRWRDIGVGFTAIDYERDGDVFVIGTSDDTEIFETPGTAPSSQSLTIEGLALTLFSEELVVVEDMFIDATTGGETFTPTLITNNGDITLDTIAPSTRQLLTQSLDRMFQVMGLRLAGTSLTSNVEIYGAEIEVSLLRLGITINGIRFEFPGRAPALNTALIFAIDPSTLPYEARFGNPVLKRLYIDATLNSNTITPRFIFTGQTSDLVPTATSERVRREWPVGIADRLTAFHLLGDFTQNIRIHRIEVDIYVPESIVGSAGRSTVTGASVSRAS